MRGAQKAGEIELLLNEVEIAGSCIDQQFPPHVCSVVY